MNNTRLIELLAQGVSPSQVMTITGASSEYMKLLLASPEFVAEVDAKKKGYYREADEQEIVGNKYLALEHKILRQIEGQLGNAEFKDALRALEVVSSRQVKMNAMNARSGAPVAQIRNTVNNITLQLPSHTIPEYVLNNKQEVISVGSVGMSPMPGAQVRELFANMLSDKGDSHV